MYPSRKLVLCRSSQEAPMSFRSTLLWPSLTPPCCVPVHPLKELVAVGPPDESEPSGHSQSWAERWIGTQTGAGRSQGRGFAQILQSFLEGKIIFDEMFSHMLDIFSSFNEGGTGR